MPSRAFSFALPLAVIALPLAVIAAPAGYAQVTLETTVSKVETTLENGGQVKRQLRPADTVLPGEELRYTITFRNDSPMVVDAGRIIITNPLPEGTRYVPGSAGGEDAQVEFSTDGETFSDYEPAVPDASSTGPEAAGRPAQTDPGRAGDGQAGEGTRVKSLRWTYEEDLAPGEASEVFFHVRMQ